MGRMIKQLFSLTLAIVMLICMMPVSASAEGTGYTAKLFYTSVDWGVEIKGDVTTTVKGDGTYTLTVNLPEGKTASGSQVLYIDIEGAVDKTTWEEYITTVENISVSADGTAIPVDMSKVVYGNLEWNGNYRIELYNAWGSTASAPAVDINAISFSETLTVSFTVDTIEEDSGDNTDPSGNPEESTTETTQETTRPAASGNTALGYASGDWSVSEWGDNVRTNVTGAGTYTLTWNPGKQVSGAAVFVVDVTDGYASLSEYELTAVSVTADGASVPVDMSKVQTRNNSGAYRIELYNSTNPTGTPAINAAGLSFSESLTVAFTLAEQEEDPTESTGASDPTESTGASDPTESTGASDPTESTGASDPTESTGASDPTESTGASDSTESTTEATTEATEESTEATEETEAASGNAMLYFNDADWSVGTYDAGVPFTVTGAGTYTVSWTPFADAEGVITFYIQVAKGSTLLRNCTLTDLKVTADGVDVPVDLNKVLFYNNDDGSKTIEIYNAYNSYGTGSNPPIDPNAFKAGEDITVTFTLYAPPSDSTNANTGDSFNPGLIFVMLVSAAALGLVLSKRKEYLA